jgi:hypothetical protein
MLDGTTHVKASSVNGDWQEFPQAPNWNGDLIVVRQPQAGAIQPVQVRPK